MIISSLLLDCTIEKHHNTMDPTSPPEVVSSGDLGVAAPLPEVVSSGDLATSPPEVVSSGGQLVAVTPPEVSSSGELGVAALPPEVVSMGDLGVAASLPEVKASGDKKKSAKKPKAKKKAQPTRKNHPHDGRLMGFGKHRNLTYQQVKGDYPGYCSWVMDKCTQTTSPEMISFLHYLGVQNISAATSRSDPSTYRLGFGKHAGETYEDVLRNDPGYCQWAIQKFKQGGVSGGLARFARWALTQH